jgi:hypothetical protein
MPGNVGTGKKAHKVSKVSTKCTKTTSDRVTLIKSKVEHNTPHLLYKFEVKWPIGSAEIGITVPIFGHFFQKLLKLKNRFRANEVSDF